MDRADNPARNPVGLIQRSALEDARRLCAAFSHASNIGFAILDDRWHFQTLNAALAAMNGLLRPSHLENDLRDLLGHCAADLIEPQLCKVVSTRKPVSFELKAQLVARSEPGVWVEHYFPIKGRHGTMTGIGCVVLDVTRQRKLESLLGQFTRGLQRQTSRSAYWLASELRKSVNQYHRALSYSLGLLTSNPEKSAESLTAAVKSLDERILAMRQLITMVADQFAVHGDA